MTVTPERRSLSVDPLDRIGLTETERVIAEAYLRRGEFMGRLLRQVAAGMRSAAYRAADRLQTSARRRSVT